MAGGPTIVTGAAGFAGSHLLDRFAGRDDVIGWARPGATPPARAGVRWHAVDVLDAAAVAAAIRSTRPAAIYHLAGAAQVSDSWQRALEHLRLHVLGTHHLLDAVGREAPHARVLVITSGLIYRPSDQPLGEDAPLGPVSPYGMSKLAEDQLALDVRQDGLDVVVARPFNHTGPRQSASFAVPAFARQLAAIEAGAAPPEIHVGNLEARRDLTDVRDVAAAYEALMLRGRAGRAYNVCHGTTVRIGDLLDRLIAIARRPVTIVADASLLRPLDHPVVHGDRSRISGEVGWMPAIPLETTLADTLEWWRGAQTHAHA